MSDWFREDEGRLVRCASHSIRQPVLSLNQYLHPQGTGANDENTICRGSLNDGWRCN